MNKSMLARNAACNAVVRLVDQSSTPTAWPTGRLYIYGNNSSLAAVLNFSNPSYRDATDGISQANPISDSTVYMDSTVSWFRVMNRDQEEVWTGTIGRTDRVGGDMKFDSVIFPKDSTVTITSASYSVSA